MDNIEINPYMQPNAGENKGKYDILPVPAKTKKPPYPAPGVPGFSTQKIPVLKECLRYALDNHTTMNEFMLWAQDKFDISPQEAKRHWKATWNLLKKKYDFDRKSVILKHTDMYWDIYKRAIDNNDLATARQTLNDLAKLLGLNEPDKVEVKSAVIKLNFGQEQEQEEEDE